MQVVFMEFGTTSLLFYVLFFWPPVMYSLVFPARIKPAPAALEGKILTTELPGKSNRGTSL